MSIASLARLRLLVILLAVDVVVAVAVVVIVVMLVIMVVLVVVVDADVEVNVSLLYLLLFVLKLLLALLLEVLTSHNDASRSAFSSLHSTLAFQPTNAPFPTKLTLILRQTMLKGPTLLHLSSSPPAPYHILQFFSQVSMASVVRSAMQPAVLNPERISLKLGLPAGAAMTRGKAKMAAAIANEGISCFMLCRGRLECIESNPRNERDP